MLGDEGLVPIELWNQSLACMDFWLCRFIIECRRKDGSPYPPNTLYNISASIQRTLRDIYGRNEVSILDEADINFADFRKQLDARMKELTSQGIDSSGTLDFSIISSTTTFTLATVTYKHHHHHFHRNNSHQHL